MMGWISDRHMRQGGSLNRNPARQRKGPLRKIVAELRASGGLFDPPLVELECGHSCRSSGAFRARCSKCLESENA
jgi:hypothetical protein